MRQVRFSAVAISKLRTLKERVRYCFFFQAEDGIRDYKVTGVQTCALPISRALQASDDNLVAGRQSIADNAHAVDHPSELYHSRLDLVVLAQDEYEAIALIGEIGRASCRERV